MDRATHIFSVLSRRTSWTTGTHWTLQKTNRVNQVSHVCLCVCMYLRKSLRADMIIRVFLKHHVLAVALRDYHSFNVFLKLFIWE